MRWKGRAVRLGWIFLTVGLIVLVDTVWGVNILWLMLTGGIAMFVFAFIPGFDGNMIFPGTVLLGISGALILRNHGPIDFVSWHIWMIFFLSLGMGFLFSWMLRSSGWWALFPGGLLLIAGGGAMAFKTFDRYQIWLRNMTDYWPLWLSMAAVIALIIRWRQGNTTSSVSLDEADGGVLNSNES